VLALVDPDAADKQFDAFWSEEHTRPNRRWAVRIAGSNSFVSVDIAAPHKGPVTIDLTIEAAGCFYRDRRYVLVPEPWFDHLVPAQSSSKDDRLDEACGRDPAEEHLRWLSFSSPALAKRPLGETRVGMFAGRLPLGSDDIARVELDLAKELTRVPADLHTAIVLDHSRSLSGDEVDNARAVVTSYLQHVPPQSRVQVIAYAREVKPLLASWQPAVAAAARIDREIRSLAPRNGSNVDAAITEAGRWLARAKGTRRLIIISDDRFPSRVDAMTGSQMTGLLPEGTLVHVVITSAGAKGMQLTDREHLGGLAALTEGIAVTVGLDDDETPTIDASMLVRPLGLDNVEIKGRGWEDLGLGSCPREDTLLEGESCTWWAKGTSVAGAISVEAFLWGKKITRMVVPDATAVRHVARELSARSDFIHEELRKRIDRAALAVNSAWSLFATWGGAIGSSEGGGFGFGRHGFGPGCCGSSQERIGLISGRIPYKLDLEVQVAPVVERCARKGPVSIALSTTLDEIVDVQVDAPSDTQAVHTCIEEALWDLALSIPNAPWAAYSTIKFDAP
jgi:hypothetical protein